MATREVLVVQCDKCGFEDNDTTKFLHVVVSTIPPLVEGKKTKDNRSKVLAAKDLCLASCVGAPGVNREP